MHESRDSGAAFRRLSSFRRCTFRTRTTRRRLEFKESPRRSSDWCARENANKREEFLARLTSLPHHGCRQRLVQLRAQVRGVIQHERARTRAQKREHEPDVCLVREIQNLSVLGQEDANGETQRSAHNELYSKSVNESNCNSSLILPTRTT